MRDITVLNNFSEYLKVMRKDKNITYKSLAKNTGINRSMLVMLEKGHTSCNFLTAMRLLCYYDFNFNDIKSIQDFNDRLVSYIKDYELREVIGKL